MTWTITSLEKVFSATKNYCFYYGVSSLVTLICCKFDGDKPLISAGESYVRKPIFSREGGNITLFDGQKNIIESVDGDYAHEPVIYQAFQPLPRFGDSYTLTGSWIVDDEAVGIGIREDISLITKDTSRFIPHYISG